MRQSQEEEFDCSYYQRGDCRSCSLLPKGFAEALNWKNSRFLERIEKAGIESSKASPLVALESPGNSRGRVKLSVSGTIAEPVIGLLDPSFSGIDLSSCPLHFEELNQLVQAIPKLVSKFGVSPYQIKDREGELKGVILGSNSTRDSAYLRFVVRSDLQEEALRSIAKSLQETFKFLRVVSMNIQPIPHQVLEGAEEVVFSEYEEIVECLGGVFLYLHPQAFFQATPEIAERLYTKAGEFAVGFGKALDLYCGVGGFSFFLADKVELVKGVELSSKSIMCAEKASLKNGIDNCEFVCGKVEDCQKGLVTDGFDLVVVNPPRRGVDALTISAVCAGPVERLIYSSCNLETLLRDIELLQGDFELVNIQPFDMFPLTGHLEVLAILDRKR